MNPNFTTIEFPGQIPVSALIPGIPSSSVMEGAESHSLNQLQSSGKSDWFLWLGATVLAGIFLYSLLKIPENYESFTDLPKKRGDE